MSIRIDVIRMAGDAGLTAQQVQALMGPLERLVDLAQAAEREACAPRGGEKLTELVAPIKGPSARSSSDTFPPCTSPDGKQRYYDAPWRDGVHAEDDAKLLGGLPVYVIAPDGETFKCPDQAKGGR